jgi:hypothetical protein
MGAQSCHVGEPIPASGVLDIVELKNPHNDKSNERYPEYHNVNILPKVKIRFD